MSDEDFQRVQTQLALRSPKVTAPRAVNVDTLDALVLTRVCEMLLTPERVQAIVGEVAAMRESGVDAAANSLRQLREQLNKSKKKHARLLNALGDGEIESTDMFRQTLRETEGHSARLAGLIAAQERILESRVESISLAQAARYVDRLREKLVSGSAAVQKRIVRSIVQEVIVGDDEIAIVGAKSDLTEVVTGGKKNG